MPRAWYVDMSKSNVGDGGDGLRGTCGSVFVSTDDSRGAPLEGETIPGAKGERRGESTGVWTEDPSVSVLVLVALADVSSSSSSGSCIWEIACRWLWAGPRACPKPWQLASAIICRIRSSVFRNRLRAAQAG